LNDTVSCKSLIVYEPPKSNYKILLLLKQAASLLASVLKVRKRLYLFAFSIHVVALFFGYSLCCVDYGFFSVFSMYLPLVLHKYIPCVLITALLLSFTMYSKVISYVFSGVFPFVVGVLMHSAVFKQSDDYLSIVFAVLLCSVLVFSSIVITVEMSAFSKVFLNRKLNAVKASRYITFIGSFCFFSILIFISLFYF